MDNTLLILNFSDFSESILNKCIHFTCSVLNLLWLQRCLQFIIIQSYAIRSKFYALKQRALKKITIFLMSSNFPSLLMLTVSTIYCVLLLCDPSRNYWKTLVLHLYNVRNQIWCGIPHYFMTVSQSDRLQSMQFVIYNEQNSLVLLGQLDTNIQED